ncbi:hypothetical protein HAQ04_25660 [Pseudomonas sp. C2L11]|nr:hypothetical protein [Pseudomonas typographi]
MQQLSFDFTAPVVALPRMPIRATTCAAATRVTLGCVTLPALEWAMHRGLKWQTVKMRRLRGETWEQALSPELRRSTFMSAWRMHG